MKFGVCLDCEVDHATFVERVRAVERYGFEYLWLTDLGLRSHDVFPYMTLAAVNTQTLKIGAGVHPPQLRHPAVTLNTLLTVNRMSQGRAFFGFGTGAPDLVEPLGRHPLKLGSVRELVSLLRRLMNAESVSSTDSNLQMQDVALANAPPEPLPIYLAATGPKTLALGAEIADGVLAHVGAAPESLAAALASCEQGLGKRTLANEFDFTPFVYACVDDDRHEAIRACVRGARTVAYRAPHLARAAGCSAAQEKRLRDKDPDTDDIFTDRVVDKLTLSGSPADCTAKLEAMSEIGIRHTTLYLKGADMTAVIDRLGREVLPRFA